MEKTHWIEDEDTRKKFWVYTKETLGLTEDEVHNALGVESVKSYGGDKKEALAQLDEFATFKRLGLQAASHGEARVVTFLDLYAPDGTRVSVTAREGAKAGNVVETALELWRATKFLCDAKGWTAGAQMHAAKGGTAAHPVNVKPGNTMPTMPQPVTQPNVPGGNGDNTVKSGTARLKRLTINPDGKIEFQIDGFKWPFKDARGAVVVAGLFSPEFQAAGWNAETLSKSAMYTSEQIGVAYVDWEKLGKYYNVIRVHP